MVPLQFLVSNAMGGEVERVKREECSDIEHGPGFSQWKILVGPSDWENHSSGVYGAERYRTQNLPLDCLGPGLYELGIAMTSTEGGRKVRDLNSRCVITVYLGNADNMRTRLQEYGRNGSHLDGGKSVSLSRGDKGLGLFQDVFSRGFSIVVRWVPIESKKEAERMEAKLLKQFDYAWNRGGNGARRPDDIFPMLDKIVSGKTRSCNTRTKCRALIQQINGSIPSEDSEADPIHSKSFLGFQATVISRSRLRSVSRKSAVYEHYSICGVIMSNGLSCTNSPTEGNKRCTDHKGLRIRGSFSKSVGEDGSFSGICGVILEDGSTCKSSPVHGKKRCELHKGGRIHTRPSVETKTTCNHPSLDYNLPLVKSSPLSPQPISWNHAADEDSNRCGVVLGDDRYCMRLPVQGRKRCEEHKGRRVTINVSLEPKTAAGYQDRDFCTSKNQQSQPWIPSVFRGDYEMCGVAIGNGFYCRNRPLSGRKRCSVHKGQRIYGSYSSVMVDFGGLSGVCGVTMRNGSTCMSSPVPGRKRCARHKGMRVT